MTVFERTIRYIRSTLWAYEMRKIDRRLEREIPGHKARREAIRKARKNHGRCSHLIEAQQADMTAALRGD